MWWFEALALDPQALALAQIAIEAVLVVLVGLLWWRQRRPAQEPLQPGEGAMQATENLLRRLEEKRQVLEGAVEAVRAKEGLVVPHRPEPAVRPPSPPKRGGLERVSALAARGLSTAEIARQLGVPRAEVEMYLSLREGAGRQP